MRMRLLCLGRSGFDITERPESQEARRIGRRDILRTGAACLHVLPLRKSAAAMEQLPCTCLAPAVTRLHMRARRAVFKTMACHVCNAIIIA